MDRFDCQYLMATFVNVYIASFIRYQLFPSEVWGLCQVQMTYRLAIQECWYPHEINIQKYKTEGSWGVEKGTHVSEGSCRVGNTTCFPKVCYFSPLLHVPSAYLWILNKVSPELIKQKNLNSVAVCKCSVTKHRRKPIDAQRCTGGAEELNLCGCLAFCIC